MLMGVVCVRFDMAAREIATVSLNFCGGGGGGFTFTLLLLF
jgi:hypothetical protein